MKQKNEEVRGCYTIQGREFTQGILKFGQQKRLISALGEKKVKFKELFEVDGLMAGLNFLIENGIVDEFLKTVLIGPVDEIDIDEIDSDTLVPILTDFFFFNKRWIAAAVNSLRNWINTLIPKETNPLLAFWLNLTHSAKRK